MKQALLWKLSKQGYHDSYIFGTMHVKSKQVFSKVEELEALIINADLFVAEYDLDEVSFVQKPTDMLIPDGASIRDLLGEKKFNRISRMISKAFQVDIRQFEYYLPLLIVNVVAEAILTKDYGLPLDMHLWKIAKIHGKVRAGAETYEAQQKVMRKIKLKDQLKMVKDIAKNPSKYRKSILRMAKLYEEEKIVTLYNSGKKSLGKYKKILLTKRNRIMAERFKTFSSESSTFMAVGAGHLAGGTGILKLLKDQGWRLKAK